MLYSFTKHFFAFISKSELKAFFLKSYKFYSLKLSLLFNENKLANSFWHCDVKLMWFFDISTYNSFIDTEPSLFSSIFSKKYTNSWLWMSGFMFLKSFENYLKLKSWFEANPNVLNNLFKSIFCSLILNLKSEIIRFNLFSNS